MARRRGFAVACWIFVAGVALQVFLAGTGLFEMTDFTMHADLGWLLALVPVVLLALALVARVDRTTLLLVIALMVATLVQPELAAARDEAPSVAALHPVNALLIAFLAWTVARRATAVARTGDAVDTSPDAAVAD
jgi:uncharacterized protein DUF6220